MEPRPPSWKILLAFAIIYFVWGSTFLAIRVGVHEVPPFLLAGLRFAVSGILLFAWMRLRGTPSPGVREWLAASFMGTLIFLIDYGCLFWAEQRVPSGIAAVMRAQKDDLHSSFHHAAGDHPFAHAASYFSAGGGAGRGHLRRGRAREPLLLVGGGSHQPRGCERTDGRRVYLVAGDHP